MNNDICPKNFSNEKHSPLKRAKVTKKKEPKTEVKTEPQTDELEPLTGNDKASGDASGMKDPEIKTEYEVDEVPAKVPKLSETKPQPGPSRMTTRRQKKEP